MPPRLLIRLLPDGGVHWLPLDRDGRALGGERAGWPTEAAADETLLLVPTEDVLVLPVPELPGSARQRQQALPFAIEEQLAAPVEQQHVVLVQDPAAVLVVAQERLQGWLSRCREAGVHPDRVLPDAWLLPVGTLLLEDTRAVLRAAADRAIACPVGQLAEQLELLAAGGAAPAALAVLRSPGAPPAPAGAGEQRQLDASLPMLAERWPAHASANLLQGGHAPVHRGDGNRRWRAAAALALAGVLGWLGFAIAEQLSLQRLAADQQAEMEAIYRSVVPSATSVADPAARLRSLAGSRSGGGEGNSALDLLAEVAPAIAGSGRHTIDAIEFRGGALELTLRSADVATLDALRARLAAIGSLQAELTAATPGSSGVEGRLRVTRRGAG